MSNVLAYVPPGVSVSEVSSPSLVPFTSDPTSVCIVGPAQGYRNITETFLLVDNTEVFLASQGVNTTTISVVDVSNLTSTPFQPTTTSASLDYTIDTSQVATTGLVGISRSMQTTIPNGATVVVYYENSATPAQADSHTDLLTLNGTTAVAPLTLTSNTQASSINVKSQGIAPIGDYAISGAGGGSPTITWQNAAVSLRRYQFVWIDYQISNIQYSNVKFQLNANTAVNLPANSTAHVVKNAPGVQTQTTTVYSKGTTTDLDYIITGSGTGTVISRSAGTTTMGVTNDQLGVRITYQATSPTYFLPTRCFSQSDVEQKFGPAYDPSGNILNAVSFAASFAFQNGAPNVIVQALFSDPGATGARVAPTGTAADWQNTLQLLRSVEDITVVVPIISAGGLTSNDALNLSILEAVQDHLNYMNTMDAPLVAICGEDSTIAGQAAMATLRSHAQTMAARTLPEAVVLLNSGSFSVANPITGRNFNVGGQYVAAAIAGLCASNSVQTSLTRSAIVGFQQIRDVRSTQDMNTDASFGLTVIFAPKNQILIRHAQTLKVNDLNKRDLSVIRAKQYMIRTVKDALESQAIGQIPLDGLAPFRVQTLVATQLETLVSNGAIVSYYGVQAGRDPVNPTQINVQFSYLPSYPLNYINISFSIDASQGIVSTSANATTAVAGA